MYFVYRHIRLDKNEPFYIGIGTRRFRNSFEQDYQRAFKKSQRTSRWINIINKTQYRVDILIESDNLELIFLKEKEFIELYGRSDLTKGTLVNLTDGGDGGFNMGTEQKTAISNKMIGNKNAVGYIVTNEQKKIVSERFTGNTTWKGRKHKNASKLLISEAKKNVPLSKSHRENTYNTKPHSKQVLCINNNIKYNSICECVRQLFNCHELAIHKTFRNYKHQISFICNNKKESYKGYNFKFV